MSKGSKPRPIDKEAYDSNFEKIFGEKPIAALTDTEQEPEEKESKNDE